jgi:general stress protein CsbA
MNQPESGSHMRALGRKSCIALLLVIVFSQAAYGAHVATHLTVDLNHCSVCGGQSNPAHAVPVDVEFRVSFFVSEVAAEVVTQARHQARVMRYRPRGPPATAE